MDKQLQILRNKSVNTIIKLSTIYEETDEPELKSYIKGCVLTLDTVIEQIDMIDKGELV